MPLLLPSVVGRVVMSPFLMFAFMGIASAELTLVREGEGPGSASWSYSLLPSTFPLTWDEARAACEALPGSMLARVEGWEAEAALEEYLKALTYTMPVWLANRQTLPEVMGNEEREMRHVGVGVGVSPLADDLVLGGDVGVTLRCAAYRVGVGVVHELCSAGTMTAALCLQRLPPGGRPHLDECPPSLHRQWLLVSQRALQPTAQAPDEGRASVLGLQPCHRQRKLGHAPCHPKNGWSHAACPSQSSSAKQQRSSKKSHRSHHRGRERARPSRRSAGSNDVSGATARREKRMAAEDLNLESVEGVMRDSSDPESPKAQSQGGSGTDAQGPEAEDAAFEEDQMRLAGVTKKADGRKANPPEGMEGSEALQHHLNRDDARSPDRKAGDGDKGSSSAIEGVGEASSAHPAENTKNPSPAGNGGNGDRDLKPDAHQVEQGRDRGTETEAEVGAEEEMGPTYTVDAGPIFVEDSPKERGIPAPVETDQEVNETLPDELVVRILEQEQARGGRQEEREEEEEEGEEEEASEGEEEEASKGEEGDAGGQQVSIVFPEVPGGDARPDPTPRSDADEGGPGIGGSAPDGEGSEGQVDADRMPSGGERAQPPSTSIPLVFPKDEVGPGDTGEARTEVDLVLNHAVTKEPDMEREPDGDGKEDVDSAGGTDASTDEEAVDEENEDVKEPESNGTSSPPAENEQSKGNGKQALLVQIFKGIFG